MIQVEIKESRDKYRITAKGHSGYAPEGEDIVCAAVSSIMLFVASASACLNDGELIDMESGLTDVRLPKNEETELIIEALKIAFDTMRIRYGQYINFSFAGV